jgi:hypothetical protein
LAKPTTHSVLSVEKANHRANGVVGVFERLGVQIPVIDPDEGPAGPVHSESTPMLLVFTDDEIIVKVGELKADNIPLRVNPTGRGKSGAKVVAEALGCAEDKQAKKVQQKLKELVSTGRLIEATLPGTHDRSSMNVFDVTSDGWSKAVAAMKQENPLRY